MASQKKLKKWTKVYPQGTKEGDEEQRFFIALARHPKYKWRSTSAISKEANLTKERVEEIIQKYYKSGMVVQNPQNEDQWGYWERLDQPDDDDDGKTVVEKDHEKRIKKVLNPSASGGPCCGPGGACSNCPPTASAASSSCSTSGSSKAVPSKVDHSMPNYIQGVDDVDRAIEYVANQKQQAPLWDFQTALGDTIREKYENQYVKVVEVKNLRDDGHRAEAFAPEIQAEERAWTLDL